MIDNFNWTITDGGADSALKYNIYRSTNLSTFDLITSTINVNYSDSTIEVGKRYFYEISALNEFGESDGTSIKSAIIGTTPSPPKLQFVLHSDNRVDLWWDVPATDDGFTIVNYTVYRSLLSGSGYSLIGSTNDLSFTDTGLAHDKIYYYIVRSVNVFGESFDSNEIMVTLQINPATFS